VTPTEPPTKKTVNQQHNQKTKIVLCRLNQIEEESINENLKEIA
jgi:hypothetical protein